MTTKENKTLPPIVVRKSTALFIIRIIVLELIFEVIYLSWRGIIHFFPFSLETLITLNSLSLIFFLIFVTVIQNIFLIIISLRWVNDYYEIRPDEIAHITGIITKTDKSYPYRDIQSVTVHQRFFGRLFKYGSIHLYIPTLGHDLNFDEVSNPAKFAELIKRNIPKTEGRYIFRR